MRSLRRKKEGGFTLVELMIVVAIIGILAAIAIPQFAAYRERGWIASMQADVNSLRTAEEAYFVENSSYTTDTSSAGLGAFGFKGFSTGNAAGSNFAVTATSFVVHVTSDKSSKSVTFNSDTGATTTN